MALDLIHNIAGLFFKERMEDLQEYSTQSADLQSEQLFDLIREAENTEWGKKHDFKTIFSYQEFRERLPLMEPAVFGEYVEQMQQGVSNLLWPGLPKHFIPSQQGQLIPISDQALDEVFYQGLNDAYATHLLQYPESKLFGGYFARVDSAYEVDSIKQLLALLKANEPFLSSLFNLPKQAETAENWEKELGNNSISAFKGSPEGLALLCKELEKQPMTTALEKVKQAEVLFHRCMETHEKLQQRLELAQLPIPVQSSCMAPEGFFGIQDRTGQLPFLLMLDLSTFYEFIPRERIETATPLDALPLEDVQLETDYQLVVSNCSGLWRYRWNGPLFRFVSSNPYRFILV